MTKAFLSALVDLLAPAICVGCDLPLDGAVGAFCDGCGPLLEVAPGTSAPFLYGGPLADGIKRLKYGGRTDLAPRLGALWAEACAAREAGLCDVVVPVPLHPRRRRARGFDQSVLLAGPLARAVGSPLVSRALARVRDTPAQARLRGSTRRQNLRGAFAARDAVRGARVLVVDDVRTTGATLEAAAAALVEAGAAEVRQLALARAEG